MKFTETIPKQYFYSIETTWLYKVYLFSLVHPHIWTSSNEHAFRDGQKPFLRTISSIAISPWKLLPQTPSNTTCSENKQPNLMKGFFFFFGMLPLGYCYPAEVSKAPNLKKKKKWRQRVTVHRYCYLVQYWPLDYWNLLSKICKRRSCS